MSPSPLSKQNKQKQHSLCSVPSTAMTPKRVNIIITFFFKGINLLSWRFAMGLSHKRASLVAELVKNLPAMQKTPVQLLGQEDPLAKG